MATSDRREGSRNLGVAFFLSSVHTLSLLADPRRHEGEDIGPRGVRGPAGDGAGVVAAPLRPGVLGGGVSQGPQGMYVHTG